MQEDKTHDSMFRPVSITCAVILLIALALNVSGLVQLAPSGGQSDEASTTPTASEASAQLESEVGAFEITARQRQMAQQNEAGYDVIDAGRGNPNWINSMVRRVYARLMDFAIDESERVYSEGFMAGQAQREGIGERFDAATNTEDGVSAYLAGLVNYCSSNLGLDRDDVLFELVNGIIGDYYPTPSRCLPNTEVILNAYLQSTLYGGVDLAAETDVFPTEGGSAAMSYIFHSLSHNKVLKPGDKIAIATPIFTPYLQIPDVNNYGLVSIEVASEAYNGWDIAEDELAKLEDPEVKAFFLVNPSNPASHALSEQTIDRIAQAVEKNPNLIVLTDDVYGTFVNDFRTVYSRIPHNTILVYSFSKLHGVTGWRTGLIAMNRDNVVDRLIRELPQEDKDLLEDEYSIVADYPASMPFIERIVADSRSIGLYHTSGLSTPSQVFMDIMALSHLVSPDADGYMELANATVSERYYTLMRALGMPTDDAPANARYYTLVDIRSLVTQRYGWDFAVWFDEQMTDFEFLDELAAKKGVVLMYGPGFDAPEGCVRISVANISNDQCTELARRVLELLDEHYGTYAAQIADAA
ncbi:MAG: bifunctional aspartate transaminase/aspartate 4-decarboxylase [Atopobiaceae bacterium]|nr:bifunctional aspartate transaminase/aspartate 4-decarboxylase [Atopobiaceae bacterium]